MERIHSQRSLSEPRNRIIKIAIAFALITILLVVIRYNQEKIKQRDIYEEKLLVYYKGFLDNVGDSLDGLHDRFIRCAYNPDCYGI